MTNATARGVRGIGRRAALLFGAVLALMLASLIVRPNAARAANSTFAQDTTLTIDGPGITLTILSGSQADAGSTTSTTFTVTVAAAEAMTVRYPGPTPGRFPNDGGLPDCNFVGGNNDLVINGPITVTVTPNTTACGAPSGGGGGGGATTQPVIVAKPNGGETLSAGQQYGILWSAGGSESHSIRIHLSTDGGNSYPTLIAENESDDGIYSWTVPDTATIQGKIRVQAVASGNIVRYFDTSDGTFTVLGTSPPPPEQPQQQPLVTTPPPTVDTTSTGSYNPGAALTNTPDINADLGLLEKPIPAVPPCTAGSLIRASLSTVYFCGRDGKRYVFPNERIFKTWFKDFSSVTILTDAQLAAIPLGGNVTYRPGVRMIKIQTDPKVYAISRGGLLRWVSTEVVAINIYGPDWNKKIDDVPDSFFFSYEIGEPITDGVGTAESTAPVTPTPTSTPGTQTIRSPQACSSNTTFTEFLSVGMTHAQVAALQDLLKCLGLFPSSLASTGYFGSQTSDAVKKFQSANGIDPRGYVGPGTREALNAKY